MQQPPGAHLGKGAAIVALALASALANCSSANPSVNLPRASTSGGGTEDAGPASNTADAGSPGNAGSPDAAIADAGSPDGASVIDASDDGG